MLFTQEKPGFNHDPRCGNEGHLFSSQQLLAGLQTHQESTELKVRGWPALKCQFFLKEGQNGQNVFCEVLGLLHVVKWDLGDIGKGIHIGFFPPYVSYVSFLFCHQTVKSGNICKSPRLH